MPNQSRADIDGRFNLKFIDGGQTARIALRKARVEQSRAAKLKSDSSDGNLVLLISRSVG